MAFTEEQEKAAKSAVDRHLKACPLCGSKSFYLESDLYYLPTLRKNGVNLAWGQPCLSVACKTCGHVMLFNVFYLGLGNLFNLKQERVSSEPSLEGAKTSGT